MKRSSLFISIIILMALLLSACSGKDDTISNTTESVPTNSPDSGDDVFDDTLFSDSNPISQFMQEYIDDVRLGVNAYCQRSDEFSKHYSTLMVAHISDLSEVYITVGRLSVSSLIEWDNIYGEGSLSQLSEGTYSFNFTYNNGDSLTGSLDNNILKFTLISQSGQTKLVCRIEKTLIGYLSYVSSSGTRSALYYSGKLMFASGIAQYDTNTEFTWENLSSSASYIIDYEF